MLITLTMYHENEIKPVELEEICGIDLFHSWIAVPLEYRHKVIRVNIKYNGKPMQSFDNMEDVYNHLWNGVERERKETYVMETKNKTTGEKIYQLAASLTEIRDELKANATLYSQPDNEIRFFAPSSMVLVGFSKISNWVNKATGIAIMGPQQESVLPERPVLKDEPIIKPIDIGVVFGEIDTILGAMEGEARLKQLIAVLKYAVFE